MLQHETEHYIFHFHPGSAAQREIKAIAAEQEACFAHITGILGVMPEWKVQYFLCDTPEEVGHFYGDNDPCNGFTRLPNEIYAVYNAQVRCIGFHEDAHIVSYCINRPPNAAVREGFAMFFDRRWWGISNQDWVLYYLQSGAYVPVSDMLENHAFFALDCARTYPIMGAFTEFLLQHYGKERYLDFYRRTDGAQTALCQVYGKTAEQLNEDFVRYTKLFRLDEAVADRLQSLCKTR